MSTPLPRMNTLFVGCEPRLPGSLNATKETNQLSLSASLPFSAALSLPQVVELIKARHSHDEKAIQRDSVLTVAAVLSFFTARSVRLDNESSKLLLLTPHNDTVYDLQDALGLPASNYPPTLYDFYLTILYKQNFLATKAENLKLFNRPDHTGTREITSSLHEVTPMEIYWHIQKHSDVLTPQLEAFALLGLLHPLIRCT